MYLVAQGSAGGLAGEGGGGLVVGDATTVLSPQERCPHLVRRAG
jgi:hypothetical protein